MPLYVRANGEYEPLPNTEARCIAYVHVREDNGYKPLPAARWHECDENFCGAQTLPDLLLSHEDTLRMLLTLFVEALANSNTSGRLEEMFGGSVNPEGFRGASPQPSARGFMCEATEYPSVEALIDATVECLEDGSAHHPFNETREGVEFRPLLSAQAAVFLAALLEDEPTEATHGHRLHLHWGAISMAGYPPKSQGYLNHRSTRRSLRFMASSIDESAHALLPLRFALLPAPILSLIPPAEFVEDFETMQALFERVLARTSLPGSDPNVAQGEIDTEVSTWLTKNQGALSPYVLNRFGVCRSVHNQTLNLPEDGAPAPLGLLGDLTMQQATMLLGSLLTQAANHV